MTVSMRVTPVSGGGAGNVLVAIPWREVKEVVDMANDSHYGLAVPIGDPGRTTLLS